MIGKMIGKTKEIIKRAQGGVLFIDEAYYLCKQSNERDCESPEFFATTF